MTPGSHRVIVRVEAEADITEAALWYERRKPTLGLEFIAEVESAIASATRCPRRA
jgi:plasmid stabilization system protein ParE